MTYTATEKDFPFADLDGSENDIKLARKIRLAYISWQLNQASPYIELNEIKRTDSAYWITNYAWILKAL